ncbi:hypothetical protein IJV79_03725, partial [bacterium]|nr:hypothetical protein [bacterium]
VTFKEKFESHLKKLATCEDYDICLTDGSKFNYGTYAEGCPTGTCMELTIDTNGNKFPNKSGKDIFTMLVTDRGIKALGESNMCETGLDCGAYILANHKLYDGTVEEVAPPVHEPDVEEPTPPVVEPEPEPESTPEELAQAAYNNCLASGATTCTNPSGQTEYKDLATCKSSGVSSCKFFNGDEITNYGGLYTYRSKELVQGGYDASVAYCESKGMRIPTYNEMAERMQSGVINNDNYDFDCSTHAKNFYWMTYEGDWKGYMCDDFYHGSANNQYFSDNDALGVVCVSD